MRAISIFLSIVVFLGAPAQAQEAATTGPDWEAAKKESDARKAAADARAAEYAAETAATKARFGTLADVSRDGTTTAGDKAGQLESAILSAQATGALATLIVRDLCARVPGLCSKADSAALAQRANAAPTAQPAAVSDPAAESKEAGPCGDLHVPTASAPKLFIVTEAEKMTFDTADVVQASLCGAERKLDRAITASETLDNDGQVAVIGLPAILTGINVAGNLLRSDFAVQGVTLTADDLLLAKAVAQAAQGKVSAPILIPQVYRPTALGDGNPLLAAIEKVDARRDVAARKAAEHKRKAAALAKKGKSAAAEAKKHTDVAAALDSAVKGYEDYLAKIATPSDKGVSELADAARQMRTRSDLANGSYVLSLKANAAGGSTYTKKNFFASMVGVPFYVSGGSVASFTLLNGRTGEVVGAGSYARTGGFTRIGKLHQAQAAQ